MVESADFLGGYALCRRKDRDDGCRNQECQAGCPATPRRAIRTCIYSSMIGTVGSLMESGRNKRLYSHGKCNAAALGATDFATECIEYAFRKGSVFGNSVWYRLPTADSGIAG